MGKYNIECMLCVKRSQSSSKAKMRMSQIFVTYVGFKFGIFDRHYLAPERLEFATAREKISCAIRCIGTLLHLNGDMLLLPPDPFRWMGAWRKTMEPQKQGNYSPPAPEAVEKQRVATKRTAQRLHSWTVQNEMRGVLGQVSAGTT